jgi:hypothetical protein
MRILFMLALAACHEDKPIVTPNAPSADCSAERTQQELQCVQDNPTRAGADKCIADLPKRDCTKLAPDGGV